MQHEFFRSLGIVALAAGFFVSHACSDEVRPLRNSENPPVENPSYAWAGTADSLQAATYTTFLSSNGTFRQDNTGNNTFHYWWNAHMLDVLADGYARTADEQYVPRMKALLRGIHTNNGNKYQNVFNDDMEWLGIACTRAYQLTQDEEYLQVARELWNEVKKGWTDVFGGGIMWKTDTPYSKNACSNGPGAILAMRLFQLEQKPEDLDWAKRIYAWQKATLVDPANGLVWDNIARDGSNTVINKDWIFTYNLGTYIGAALDLYEETGEQAYLNDAIQTANSSMLRPEVTTEGLLKSEGQGDGGLFKGILIRYLVQLIRQPDLSESDRRQYEQFLQFNAETFSRKGLRRPDMMSSPDWRTMPGSTTDLSTQLSGLMLLEAAALVQQE